MSVAPLTMTPPFSPDIYDYAVWCAAGVNALTVTAQTAGGSEASLVSPIVSQYSANLTLPVSVAEDGAMVVNVVDQSGSQSSQYWIRCLPHDFPPITLTRHPSGTKPTPGYYLTGNAIVAPPTSGFAMVLDSNATPVWYQRSAYGAVNLELLSHDVLAFMPFDVFGANPMARYQVDVLSPWQTQYVQAVTSPTDEHELTIMPNGDRLVFSYPPIAGIDLTGLQTFGPGSTVADCEIQELDVNGNLVWDWHGLDHIDPVHESTDAQTNQVNGVSVIDPLHCNSIDLDASGNLLVSARNLDAVFLIDKTTSVIQWKLNGTPYSKDNARLVTVAADPQQSFFHQHDARFQPGGNISLFDDHTKQPGPARGVVYALDLATSTATFVWQALGTGNTVAMGSFRIAADQSRVVGWGITTSPTNVSFSEVDPSGASFLDVSLGTNNYAYRAIKVALTDLDIDLLRATAAHP